MLSHTVRGSRQVSGGPVGCENGPFLPVPPPPHEAPRHLQTRVECAALDSALRIKPSPPRPASAAPATEAGDRGELHKATKGRAPWLGTVQSARTRLVKAAGSRHNGSTCHTVIHTTHSPLSSAELHYTLGAAAPLISLLRVRAARVTNT